MQPLLVSFVCDYCDGLVDWGSFHRGFIVWRDDFDRLEYVFPTREAAERWRSVRGLSGHEIREVLSEQPFRWHMSRGSVKDIELADHVYEIFPNHRHAPGQHRAFLT
jgi:hypothetical protein